MKRSPWDSSRVATVSIAIAILLFVPETTDASPTLSGCSLFPADSIWNVRVDHLPVDPNSAAYIATIGANTGVHPDFGSGTWEGGPIGIPYNVVPGTQPKVPMLFEYDDESDPGPYPIPANPAIEGGDESTGDRHVLVLDKDNCVLYETWSSYPQDDGSWQAGSGAKFDLRSNALRPQGWTSADAAGLPILPGLVRYEEILAGEIEHAIRFTAPQSRRDYLWPARHYASYLTAPQYPPLGQRFRLKASVDVSDFSPEVQTILRALKRYGLILADNGGAWFISGVPDARWNDDVLVNELRLVKGSDFEAVDQSSLMLDPNSAKARSGVLEFNYQAPVDPVPLIFIHHSTGENWLADSNGQLGIALRNNNYFVSDTNYGWGLNQIGSSTDIGHWWLWFCGPGSSLYLADLYTELEQHSSYSRLAIDPPGLENQIVMFKSCFPNSALDGSPDDPIPAIAANPLRGESSDSPHHTVANAKGIYVELLKYFQAHQNKLFVVITAPPLSDPTHADNARAFNQWLMYDWLKNYPYRNVAVFDFYNVLTTNGGSPSINDLTLTTGNHHRRWNGAVQHRTDGDNDSSPNVLEYASGDDHPSTAGNLKATGEFVPLLNIFYHCWQGSGACPGHGLDPDFDLNRVTDHTVFRAGSGRWYAKDFQHETSFYKTWGAPGDIPVTGDFDADHKTDIGVWRPANGTWYILLSSYDYKSSSALVMRWGANSDIPVPGDYNGDGRADLAVWRPANGTWYIKTIENQLPIVKQWGMNGDQPVPGDYDGDGVTDLGIWRPSTGYWYLRGVDGTAIATKAYGTYGDVPTPADYNGDGRTDLCVWRPSSGKWFAREVSGLQILTRQFGANGDLPLTGDYDGDRRTDITLWRPSSGQWFVLTASSGFTSSATATWGISGDIPVAHSPIACLVDYMNYSK